VSRSYTIYRIMLDILECHIQAYLKVKRRVIACFKTAHISSEGFQHRDVCVQALLKFVPDKTSSTDDLSDVKDAIRF